MGVLENLLSLDYANLEVWKFAGNNGKIRVNFKNCEVKDGYFLRGEYGEGNTFYEACEDYARKINGKKLVFNAYSDARKEATFFSVDNMEQTGTKCKATENESADKIKPCPFCGKHVDLPKVTIGDRNNMHMRISCVPCGFGLSERMFDVNVSTIKTINDQLIKRWNKRT